MAKLIIEIELDGPAFQPDPNEPSEGIEDSRASTACGILSDYTLRCDTFDNAQLHTTPLYDLDGRLIGFAKVVD